MPFAEDAIVRRAMRFLISQLDELERPAHRGVVALDRLVPTQHTGTVSGSIMPPATAPVAPGTWLTISDPGSLPSGYRGMVFGRAVPPAGDVTDLTGATVRYGMVTEGFAELGSVPVDAAGYFGIDLSDVETWRRGSWAFELRTASGTVAGGRWPASDVLEGLSVELRVVGATSTVVASRPAPLDGVVVFDASAPGRKRLALVDATGALLGITDASTGAIRSFVVEGSSPLASTTFAYDQAVALHAALAVGDDATAHALLAGLLLLQVPAGEQRGAFRLSGSQEAPEHGALLVRSGAHAIATSAVLSYLDAFPERRANVAPAVLAALGWLESHVVDGLVRGGFGVPGAGGIQPSTLTWASTEHNVDAFFCFALAGRVVDAGWTTLADAIGAAMLDVLWSEVRGRFVQGVDGSVLDEADPLDVHAWGALLLLAIGERDRAVRTMSEAQLAPFLHGQTWTDGSEIVGYATAFAAGGYPGMLPHVWWEGTFSVAYALRRLGDDARADEVMRRCVHVQGADGGFPYASQAVPAYDLVADPSVASTGWSVLASLGRGIFER